MLRKFNSLLNVAIAFFFFFFFRDDFIPLYSGAVTSPTILPPSSRAVSHGIGPPGPSRSDMQLSHNLSASENLLFEKEKHTTESCVHLEDCEAEAEAAASAVAVAAISSDEIVGNGLGACSVSVPDTKSFGGADIDGVAEGVNNFSGLVMNLAFLLLMVVVLLE